MSSIDKKIEIMLGNSCFLSNQADKNTYLWRTFEGVRELGCNE